MNHANLDAYDCAEKGATLIHKSDKSAKKELIATIAEAAETFIGSIVAQVYTE